MDVATAADRPAAAVLLRPVVALGNTLLARMTAGRGTAATDTRTVTAMMTASVGTPVTALAALMFGMQPTLLYPLSMAHPPLTTNFQQQ